MTDASREGPPVPAGWLKVQTSRVGGTVVCRIAGDLHVETLPKAAQALESAEAQRPRLLCVDLGEVQLCDARGLGYLQRLSRRLPVALINPSPVARRALRVTGLDRALRVLPTVEDAIAALERTGDA